MINETVWLLGDTHFFHHNIIEYCNRPFSSVEEMNEVLVDNWNRVVRPMDKVFMLGDFALGARANVVQIGNRLNGRKTLILGNHDRATKTAYREAGFEYISLYPLLFEDFFILSHHPRHVRSNGLYANIFAHVHDNPMYLTVSPRSYCVSAERIGYTPISYDEIRAAMENAESEQVPACAEPPP